jgi:hypothetical protein
MCFTPRARATGGPRCARRGSGGAEKVGSLASRSPHRPNPIGISVVELLRADLDHPEGPRLEVRGVDLLDGSPVLDVKPYLPYADAVRGATTGWAREPVPRAPVRFSRKASRHVRVFEATRPELRALIRGLLSLDPRPAFQQRRMPLNSPAAEGTRWGFSVVDLEVQWEIRAGAIHVVDVFVPDDAPYFGGRGRTRPHPRAALVPAAAPGSRLQRRWSCRSLV